MHRQIPVKKSALEEKPADIIQTKPVSITHMKHSIITIIYVDDYEKYFEIPRKKSQRNCTKCQSFVGIRFTEISKK